MELKLLKLISLSPLVWVPVHHVVCCSCGFVMFYVIPGYSCTRVVSNTGFPLQSCVSLLWSIPSYYCYKFPCVDCLHTLNYRQGNVYQYDANSKTTSEGGTSTSIKSSRCM
jgi:hypothetical protein